MLSDAKYSSTKGSSVLPQSSQQAKLMSSQVSSGPPSVVGNSVPMVQTAVISSGGSGSSKLIPQYQPIKSIMNYHNHHPNAYNYHNAYNLNSSSNQSIPPPPSSSNFQQHPIHYHHHSHAQYPHAHHHLLNVVSPMNGGSINGGGSSNSNGSNNIASNSNNNGLNGINNSSNNAKKYSSKTLASSSSSSTNSSTSSTGSVNVKFSGFFKDKIDEREKYLTAKYPNHQMALIKKRLKVEFWIDEQVKNLFSANDDNSKEDYDICADDLVDNLLDMESDNERRYFILNELSKAKKGRDEIMKFVDELLVKLRML